MAVVVLVLISSVGTTGCNLIARLTGGMARPPGSQIPYPPGYPPGYNPGYPPGYPPGNQQAWYRAQQDMQGNIRAFRDADARLRRLPPRNPMPAAYTVARRSWERAREALAIADQSMRQAGGNPYYQQVAIQRVQQARQLLEDLLRKTAAAEAAAGTGSGYTSTTPGGMQMDIAVRQQRANIETYNQMNRIHQPMLQQNRNSGPVMAAERARVTAHQRLQEADRALLVARQNPNQHTIRDALARVDAARRAVNEFSTRVGAARGQRTPVLAAAPRRDDPLTTTPGGLWGLPR